MLKPYRDLYVTYLTIHKCASIDFIAYQQRWPSTPT
jgi:hypothetical protein